MSITAVVENNTIKLPVQVPDGTKAEVTLIPQATAPRVEKTELPPAGSFFDTIRHLIGSVDGLPEDFAAEHDHYIHGTPKRGKK